MKQTFDATDAVHNLFTAAISVSLENDTPLTEVDSVDNSCGYINVSKLNPATNSFIVRTYNHGTTDCSGTDMPFMFIITGRP